LATDPNLHISPSVGGDRYLIPGSCHIKRHPAVTAKCPCLFLPVTEPCCNKGHLNLTCFLLYRSMDLSDVTVLAPSPFPRRSVPAYDDLTGVLKCNHFRPGTQPGNSCDGPCFIERIK